MKFLPRKHGVLVGGELVALIPLESVSGVQRGAEQLLPFLPGGTMSGLSL